jgi:hypothetical protein
MMTLESNMADELENEEDCEIDFRRLKESHLKVGIKKKTSIALYCDICSKWTGKRTVHLH